MKMVMPLRYNVAFLAALFGCASILFSAWAGSTGPATEAYPDGMPKAGEIIKAAFLVVVTLAPAYLSMCVMMAGRTQVHKGQAALNPTVWLVAILAMSVAGAGLLFLGLDQFKDAVVEGIFAGIAGSSVAVLTAFIKQAEMADEE